MEENPEVSLTFHNLKRSDGKKSIDLNQFPSLVDKDAYVLDLKETFNTQVQTLTLVYRNVIKRPEGLNVFNGDALLIALLAQKGRVAFLNFDGAFYRIHGGGIHAGNTKYMRILNSIASRKKMIPFFKHPIKGQLYSKTAYFYKELAKLDYNNGNYLKCLSNLINMLRYNLLYILSEPKANRYHFLSQFGKLENQKYTKNL